MIVSMTLSLGLGVLLTISLKYLATNKTLMEIGFGIESRHYEKNTVRENF